MRSRAAAQGGNSRLILVADADDDCRDLLVRLLRRVGYATCEAATGEEALAEARRQRPELVILEINLPVVAGYEVCRELRDEFGEVMRIVFVSAERTEPFDRLAGLLIGADDYVVKPFDSDELLARVRRQLARTASAQSTLFSDLTRRERQVLSLLAEGLTGSEIANELVISPKTVSTHIQRILAKLGVHTRAQAVVLALHARVTDRAR